MKEKRDIYTIMPEEVRHDKKISPLAKLIFTEIPTFPKNMIGDYVVDIYLLSNLYHVSQFKVYSCLKQLEKQKNIINIMGHSWNINILVHLSHKYNQMFQSYLSIIERNIGGKFYE